jgi:hypothetical protein
LRVRLGAYHYSEDQKMAHIKILETRELTWRE